jgi:hypothetical protein
MAQGGATLRCALKRHTLSRGRFQYKVFSRPDCDNLTRCVIGVIPMRQYRAKQRNCANTCYPYAANQQRHTDEGGDTRHKRRY